MEEFHRMTKIQDVNEKLCTQLNILYPFMKDKNFKSVTLPAEICKAIDNSGITEEGMNAIKYINSSFREIQSY